MNLQKDMNHAVLALSQNWQRNPNTPHLVLTDQERKTLTNALDICERAAKLLNEDDTGDFFSAAAWLWAALN